jgi:hypothetical protein
MGTRQTWVGILVMLVGLLLLSADLGYTDRGGHRHWGHGHRGHGHWGHGHRGHRHWGHWHRGHWHGGSRVFISPSIIVPFGPFWGPHWGWRPHWGWGPGWGWGPHWGWGPGWPHFAHPPVVVIPPPAAVQPSPPQPRFWYYCDEAKGYYPYVAQCPGGWRAVSPTPP